MLGLPVEVLHAVPPPNDYTGYPAKFNNTPHWLVRASRPVPVQKIETVTVFMGDYPIGVSTAVSRAVAAEFTAPDACLQPVRDGEGADETLTWLPTPTTERVPA